MKPKTQWKFQPRSLLYLLGLAAFLFTVASVVYTPFVRHASAADPGLTSSPCSSAAGYLSGTKQSPFKPNGNEVCLGLSSALERTGYYQFVIKFSTPTPKATITFQNGFGNTKGAGGQTIPSAFVHISQGGVDYYVSQPDASGGGYSLDWQASNAADVGCQSKFADITIKIKNDATGASDNKSFNVCKPNSQNYLQIYSSAVGGSGSNSTQPKQGGIIISPLLVCDANNQNGQPITGSNTNITSLSLTRTDTNPQQKLIDAPSLHNNDQLKQYQQYFGSFGQGSLTFTNLPAPGTYTISASFSYQPQTSGSTPPVAVTYSMPTISNIALITGGTTVTHQATSDGCLSSASAGLVGCGTTDSNGNAESCGDYFDCGDSSGLGWITCRIIVGAQHAAGVVDNFITNTLDVDVKSIFDNTSTPGTPQNGYYTAWNSFRVLATALLIIGGLVMVVSQALGFEALDAYTIRKVLPRLLIAVIGISLSWPLMRFVVGFFDVLGFDIRDIIYAPFSHMGGSLSISVSFTGLLVAAGAAMLLGWASLTLILTALLALFVGFIILVIRQLAIIVIIIVAPIAIACYILPGTQKVWKLWRDNFLGLMMMFPIISAFIAAGHVFAVVSLNGVATSTPGAKTIGQIVGIVAYFIPYFLLPVAFRLATGVLGNIAGFINDRNRGVFDRLKKYRGARMAQNAHNMAAGTRFNNGALNKLTARATTRGFGFGARGREAYDNKMQMAAAEFAKSGHGMSTQFKDDVLWAKTYNSEREARSRLAAEHPDWDSERVNKAIAGAKASGGFGANQQVWATKQLAATGTGYDNDAEMLATIARVAGNNDVLADSMYGEMRGLSERAGRNDLKSGYATGTKILKNIREQNRSSGTALTGRQLEADTRAGGFGDQLTDFGIEAARGVSNMSAMSQNKPKSISNMMKRLHGGQQRYSQVAAADPGTYSDDQRRYASTVVGQVRAKMEDFEAYTGYGPEVNAEALHGMREVTPGSTPGNIGHTGQRAPGYASDHEPTVAAAERVGDNVAYNEEHNARSIDPELIRRQGGPPGPGDEEH